MTPTRPFSVQITRRRSNRLFSSGDCASAVYMHPPTDRPIDRPTDRPTDRPNERLMDRQVRPTTRTVSFSLDDRPTDGLTDGEGGHAEVVSRGARQFNWISTVDDSSPAGRPILLVWPSAIPSVRPSVCPHVPLPFRLPTRPSVYSAVCTFLRTLYVSLSVHLNVRPYGFPSIRSSFR